MIEIDDKIISTEILTTQFSCDISRCKGICCVEGNSGAPLEAEEADELEAAYDTFRPYMKPEGIEAVERQGFMVVDVDGDYTTPNAPIPTQRTALLSAPSKKRTERENVLSTSLFPVISIRSG